MRFPIRVSALALAVCLFAGCPLQANTFRVHIENNGSGVTLSELYIAKVKPSITPVSGNLLSGSVAPTQSVNLRVPLSVVGEGNGLVGYFVGGNGFAYELQQPFVEGLVINIVVTGTMMSPMVSVSVQ